MRTVKVLGASLFGVALTTLCARAHAGGALEIEVTNGTLDNDDQAVVALMGSDATQPTCTGTLIAPTWVLTAAHCVTQGAPSAVRFDAPSRDNMIAVSDAVVHPSFDPITFANDLALLRLAEEAPVAPVKMGTVTSNDVDAIVRVVGFGVPTPNDFATGVKTSGNSLLAEVDPTSIRLVADPSQPCFGDSGGPVFLVDPSGAESLIGVTSHGALSCTDGALAARVAAYDAFISANVDASSDDETKRSGCSMSVAEPAMSTLPMLAFVCVAVVALRRRARRS